MKITHYIYIEMEIIHYILKTTIIILHDLVLWLYYNYMHTMIIINNLVLKIILLAILMNCLGVFYTLNIFKFGNWHFKRSKDKSIAFGAKQKSISVAYDCMLPNYRCTKRLIINYQSNAIYHNSVYELI